MTTITLRALTAAAALLGAMSGALAHDFWIEPTAYTPAPGTVIGVRLRVGEHFSGDVVPRPGAGMRRFDAVAPGEQLPMRPIVGRAGAEPAGAVRVAQPGLHLLAYHSEPIAIELPAPKFDAYLREEGLDAVLAQRQAGGLHQQPGREIYSRCAKSLVLAGPADPAQGDRVLGLPLELVAENHPFLMTAGDQLTLRLLHQGRPLAGALVSAVSRAHPHERTSARSDAEGRVRLALPYGGAWLAKAVHMVAAPPDSGADWESLWASLTFRINDRAVPDRSDGGTAQSAGISLQPAP